MNRIPEATVTNIAPGTSRSSPVRTSGERRGNAGQRITIRVGNPARFGNDTAPAVRLGQGFKDKAAINAIDGSW